MSKNPEKPSRPLFSEQWAEAWQQVEERVRQQPGLHLLMALAIGYLLQVIPFRSLLVLAGKICLKLAGPALLLFCAFLLAKYVRMGSSSGSASE